LLDQINEALEGHLAIATTLVPLIDEEMEDPVLVRSAGLVGELDEPNHRGAGIDGIGGPYRAVEMEVGFGERDGNNWGGLGDEALVVGGDGEAERFSPICLCHRAQLDVHGSLSSSNWAILKPPRPAASPRGQQ